MAVSFKNEIDQFPQDILAGIGEIIARWGYVEHQLRAVIRYAVGLPPDSGRVLLGRADISALVVMLRTISVSDRYIISDDALRADITALAQKVEAKKKTRNAYAHGVYLVGSKKVKPKSFGRVRMDSPTNKIRPDLEPITAATLKSVANEADELWRAAQLIKDRLKKTSLRKRA